MAAAGVRGADPDEWWGLAALSTDDAGGRPDRPVPVSPSPDRLVPALRTARAAARTSAPRTGSRSPPRSARSSTRSPRDRARRPTSPRFEALLDERVGRPGLRRAVVRRNERRAGEPDPGQAGRLAAGQPRASFTLVGHRAELQRRDRRRACSPAGSTGSSATTHGRLVVVDLKTGKSQGEGRRPADASAARARTNWRSRPARSAPGEQAGGALLVQLGRAPAQNPEQRQGPLAEAEDPRVDRRPRWPTSPSAMRGSRVHRDGQDRLSATATCGRAARCTPSRQVTAVSTMIGARRAERAARACPTPDAEQAAVIESRARTGRRHRRRRLGQDRDDGRPRGVAGREPLGRARTRCSG